MTAGKKKKVPRERPQNVPWDASRPMPNPQHEEFVTRYVANGFNAMRAYGETYKASDSESARRSASRLLLTRDDLKARLQYLCEQALKEPTAHLQARLRQALEELSLYSLTDYMLADGRIDLARIIEDKPRWVREIKTRVVRRDEDAKESLLEIEVKGHDVLKAIEHLAKIVALMPPDQAAREIHLHLSPEREAKIGELLRKLDEDEK